MKPLLHIFALLCHQASAGDWLNILFIYVDDWGWSDLACHEHPHLKTPNLDRIAREGTDFHQFTTPTAYAPTPMALGLN
jgi:N-acetylgalactosamine-6-sulfatase